MMSLGLGLSLTSQRGGFSPASVIPAGADWAWFEPRPENCFQDAAGTIPCAVGDPVGYYRDLSGNGWHAIQTNAAESPILRQAASGAYYLEGTGDWLLVAGLDVRNTHTVIGGVQTSSNFARAYGTHQGFWGGVYFDSATGQWRAYDGVSTTVQATTASVTGAVHVLSVVQTDVDDLQAWTDGGNSAGSVNPRNPASVTDGFALQSEKTNGFGGGPTNCFGRIVVGAALSDDARQKLEAYFAALARI